VDNVKRAEKIFKMALKAVDNPVHCVD